MICPPHPPPPQEVIPTEASPKKVVLSKFAPEPKGTLRPNTGSFQGFPPTPFLKSPCMVSGTCKGRSTLKVAFCSYCLLNERFHRFGGKTSESSSLGSVARTVTKVGGPSLLEWLLHASPHKTGCGLIRARRLLDGSLDTSPRFAWNEFASQGP